MKIVLQRVKQADVVIDGQQKSRIQHGYVLLVGFEKGDDERFLEPMIEKILKIKLFPDDNGRFAFSLPEVKGSILSISQFTLFADLKKGKKPSLSHALEPDKAADLYEDFVGRLSQNSVLVADGEFGALMQVSLQNDGPVTLILDSKELFPSLY